MEKKYRTKVKKDTKTIGQLAYEKHWSVVGLIKSLNYKQEELDTWAKLNKQS
jgi:gas vesicle protein